MNTDGSNARRLTDNTTDDRAPSWSPSGTQIVYSGYLDGRPQLFIVNSDGSDPQQLTHGDHHAFVASQAWSPHTPGAGSDFFDDVPAGHAADLSVGWAFTNKITTGIAQRRFGLDGTVTRAQIVTFLHRTANLLEDN